MTEKMLLDHIESMKAKVDFSAIEMNLRADLVMDFGVEPSRVAAMSDDEVVRLLDKLDCDCHDEDEYWEHTIRCKCGNDVHLTNGMWTDGPCGDGWYWSCPCGNGGFVWEGAFDSE